MPAAERLQDLFRKSPGNWSAFPLSLSTFPGELAAAEIVKDDGVKWIHVYITTSWLAIYATVSGQPSDLASGCAAGWALHAIRGIQLTPV
jgi:hypothetical protein